MNAKKFALVTAGLCATMFFAACDSTEKQNTSAGAMGEKSSCCTDAKKCDAKCTSDAKTCTKGAECCMTKATATTPAVAPGAVGEKKEGCCSTTTKTSAKTESCCPTMTKTSDKVEGCSSTTTKTSAKASSCCPAMTEGAKCPVTGTTNG